MHHSLSVAIDNRMKFELEYAKKAQLLLMSDPTIRGAAHAMNDDTTLMTHELLHVTEVFQIGQFMGGLQAMVEPNLPWAEDHFQERVGGEPLNPSPSEAWWPFARQGNAEHKVHDQKFSHTYPERFWPKQAGEEMDQGRSIDSPTGRAHFGIRFGYGDLQDLVEVLRKNPMSRQAYLPIWFPEDLTAAVEGSRVPCSLGYHFLMTKAEGLDCVYTMRSCDIVRFYRDDIYMAGRLLQWVADHVGVKPGKLVVHINNLHCFPGDRAFLEKFASLSEVKDKRATYNFEAL